MLNLPDYPDDHLENAPLVFVVCQVRFEDTGDVPRTAARDVQLALDRNTWSELEPSMIVTGLLGPAGIGQQPTRQAWQIFPEDRQKGVTINPDSASLESRSYGQWDDFKATFAIVLRAVDEALGPQRQHRLGLRYVNQFELPDGVSNWEGLIPSELLGPVTSGVLKDGVVAAEQRIVLNIAGGIRCVFRHGAFEDTDGNKKYVLDYDLGYEDISPFDVEACLDAAEALHTAAWRLFRVTITDDLFEKFRKEAA
jgi:uncharacterized protein (TIGR04255 family)